jgi:hypothetical protein
MTKLEQIERSILELSRDELNSFTDWFEAMMEKRFDDDIEHDALSGKLDSLVDRAIEHSRAGRMRPI